MSFSLEVKKELSEIKNLANKEEVKFELMGYLISNNTTYEDGEIKYSTENEYNINRFAKILRNMDIQNFNITVQGKIFIIFFEEKEILKAENSYKKNIVKIIESTSKVELLKSFMRGVFLGAGSINNPENTYHLEFGIRDIANVELILNLMKKFDMTLKVMENYFYIKDGEEISKFLAFIGANKSVLRFEEIRVQRYMNNKVNRLVNCKTANLNKTLNASVEQIDAIKKLKDNGDFENLDESLKEIANLRLEYPDVSLVELGQKLKNPIGKSGVNYRLKKIIKIARN